MCCRNVVKGVRYAATLLMLLPGAVLAQFAHDVIPATAPNCAVDKPAAESGLAATPGGFVVVHPRNDALTKQYTGCKAMWVVTGERHQRIATLYFKDGVLAVAAAHNMRDASGRLDGACAYPEGKSLLPDAGRQVKDSGCTSFAQDAFYGLYLPTWPMICLTDAKAAICQQEPR
jgi:hypothetical protein